MVPALQAMGHEVIALPSVLLSNHPGHPYSDGMPVEPRILGRMLDALHGNGWLAGVDGVLTGYLPSAAHVGFACEAVVRLRDARPGAVYLCDPVMGDDPGGLYIAEDAAAALRHLLAGIADIVTPNRFEAGYLAAQAGGGRAREGAVQVTTSVRRGGSGELRNELAVAGQRFTTRVPIRADAPHGTGDLFAALYLGRYLAGRDHVDALGFATAGVDATLAASQGLDMLSLWALMPHLPGWAGWPVECG